VLATATATSLLDALIAGDRAVIAVTPQIEVPAVNRSDISSGSPTSLLAIGIYNMPTDTLASTTGKPAAPAFINSKNDNLAATQTIPVCNIVLVLYVIPVLNVSLLNPIVLLIAIPNSIDVGIPDNGRDIDDDIKEAKPNPAVAVAVDNATPGMMDDDCGLDSSSFFKDEAE